MVVYDGVAVKIFCCIYVYCWAVCLNDFHEGGRKSNNALETA